MQTNADVLATTVGVQASNEMGNAMQRIRHCLAQLNDDQIWSRPSEAMNTTANLILHLCGNVRQWIISGVGGAEDMRQRPLEFSLRGPIAGDELLKQLEQTVADAKAVLTRVSASELLRTRRIQGFDVTGMQAIFESVAHFRGHTQEIIHMTRCQLGDAYRFAWSPSTAEEGAT